MKKVKILILLVSLSMFLHCGASMLGGLRGDYYDNKITESYDKFEDIKRTTVNLSMPSFEYMAELAIRFEKVVKGKNVTYIMSSYVYQKNWVFVESIKIKLNDKMYEFLSVSNTRNVKNEGYVEERNIYKTDRKFIEELSSVSDVSIRLKGKDVYVNLKYDNQKHKKLVKKFLQKTK
jgi:hypothetical protein